MAAPVKTKTWQYNVDNLQAALGTVALDNSSLIYALKNALQGFGSSPWVCDYSCLTTGNVGTKGDGTDRLTSAAAIVWNTAGSAHSWIVLKQGTFELCFDFSNNTGTRNVMTIVVSWGAGFTGGSATARPTATDEKTIITNGNWLVSTTDLAMRWSIQMATDGTSTRLFVFAGGSQILGAFFDQMTQLTTGNTNPWVAFWSSGAGYSVGSLSGVIFPLFPASVQALASLTCEATISGTALYSNQIIANETDGTWPAWPLGLYVSGTVGARGKQGNLQDIWFGSTSATTGDSYPLANADFLQVGGCIIPWNQGPFHTS